MGGIASRRRRGHLGGMRKPPWVIEKERARRGAARETLWLFGLHAVRDALLNPVRDKIRLVVTRNALDRLGEAAAHGPAPEIADPRRFPAPLDPGSVHQGAALEVRPLDWGAPEDHADGRPVVFLDRVTDPHNVGAVLRSAEVLGAAAVIAPARHAAPETGALAKAASGALERQPYLRVANLAGAMTRLREAGYAMLGLDGEADATLDDALAALSPRPVGLVLGAEGPGLRERTRETCDAMARIAPPWQSGISAGEGAGAFGSLNVSNAAAVALYAASRRGP